MKKLIFYPVLLVMILATACGLPTKLPAVNQQNSQTDQTQPKIETPLPDKSGSTHSSQDGAFKAEVTSAVSVMLNWDGITADKFLLEGAVSGSEFITLVELSSDVSSYELIPIIPDRTFQFRLTPFNGDSRGKSLTLEVTTPVQEPSPLSVTLTNDQTSPDPTTMDLSAINPDTMDPEAISALFLPQETSASAEIGPEGGEISVTSSTGVKYTYRIPAGALDETIPLTLIPISAVDGAPLTGSLLGAVRILPEGLELNEAAILTIEPAPETAAGVGDLVATFEFMGDGSEFYFNGTYPKNAKTSYRSSAKLAAQVPQDDTWVMQPWEIPQTKTSPAGAGVSTKNAVLQQAVKHPPSDNRSRKSQNRTISDDDLSPIIPIEYLDYSNRGLSISNWEDAFRLIEDMESSYKNSKDKDAALKFIEKPLSNLADALQKLLMRNLQNCVAKDDFSAYHAARSLSNPRSAFFKIVAQAYKNKYGNSTLKDVLKKTERCNLTLTLDSTVTIKATDAVLALPVKILVKLKTNFDSKTGLVYFTGIGDIVHQRSGGEISNKCYADLFSSSKGKFIVKKLYPVFAGSTADLEDFVLSNYNSSAASSKANIKCPDQSVQVPFISGLDMWGGLFFVSRNPNFEVRSWHVNPAAPGGDLATTETDASLVLPYGSVSEKTSYKIKISN